jgi:predicted O-methyltransferase YrrM
MLPSDPEAISKERGWDVIPVFANPRFGEPYLNALREIREDPEHPGFSDVGIRNLIFTHILNLRPAAVLEIGAHIGTASLIIGQALKLNNFGRLYTLEPQSHFFERLEYYVDMAQVGSRVERINGLSSDESVRQQLRNAGPFEIIFVDANHNYRAVKEEVGYYWPLLSENGLMFFHDTSKVKGQSLDSEKLGGVRRAIAEAKHEFEDFNLIAYEYPLWLNDCGAAVACKQRIDAR